MAEAMPQENTKEKRLFVVAIDLGTTYSGWAYSTLDQPDVIYANQVWYAGTGSLGSLKTPTCVLFTPGKQFDSFGYDAESTYATLTDEMQHREWFYFRRFKMSLYDDRELTRDSTIKDISGKKMPALVVFAHAIRYLKDHFMETLHKRITKVKDKDIGFVLTVPAIWNDRAKRFMREAAVEAGIPNDQITIALEPEAASIWCQGLHTEINREPDNANLGISAVGTRYMIVDLGGGTADITVHERKPHNTLLEIHKPSGGAWGGTEVDKNFIKLIADVIGPSVWEKYEQQEVEDFLELCRDFENKKRNIGSVRGKYITIKTPSSLKESFEQNGARSISEIEARFEKKIEWKRDKLKIDLSLLTKCFQEPVSKLMSHIKNILSEENMKTVRKIMLVGGFAESPYVQDAFKANFVDEHFTIIIPPECGLAVLKGAVLFGQNPLIVTARIARYTYGLEISVPFDRKKHSSKKWVKTDVGSLCRDIFWKAVEIGQEVVNGHEVTRVGKAVDDNQQTLVLNVVKSKQQTPMYTTDDDCEVVGKVVIPMDSTLKADENAVDETLIFGRTELVLKTCHRTTGSKKTLTLDL